jgi:hypothetical protein
MGRYTFNIIKEEVRRMRKNVVMMTVLMVALVFALMLVAMPAVGAGDVACDWTGTWDTCWGKMELVQTGIEKWVADVNGTAYLTLPQRTNITYKPEGKITGLVFDNTLEGWWTRYPSNTIQRTRAYTLYDYTGNLVFTISEDCNSFEGEWWYGDRYKDDWGGVWTGSRVGPSKQPSKQSVCASATPSITSGGEFTTAEFTIGGTEPQEVRITQPAENFGIVKVYGGKYGGTVVYKRIDGKSWGSLTLEPGTYRLSCGGGGMGLMSATVCIEYPGVEETPTGPEEELPEVEHPPELPEVSTGKESKPSLPLGPIERIIVYPKNENLGMNKLFMEIGKKKQFDAWGEDANRNKKGVTVDEWKVRGDENIGSIDKETGEFTAGPNEGDVKIMAKVGDITGVFPIKVSAVPPVTFVGKVKLYDEHNALLRIPAGGVTIDIHGLWFENRKACEQAGSLAVKPVGVVQTDARGEFKFMVPAGGFVKISCDINGYYLPSPTGYTWSAKPSLNGVSNDAWCVGPIKAGSTIHIAPEGFPCFQLWLEEMYTSVFIDGEVTHHGKPVVDAVVRLLDNGKSVKEERSDYNGYYELLYVDNLPKGSYRLTVKYKPQVDPNKPPGPGNYVTVHDWLYIRKDIPVELPLEDTKKTFDDREKKTIDIEMISFAEKVGYTGP